MIHRHKVTLDLTVIISLTNGMSLKWLNEWFPLACLSDMIKCRARAELCSGKILKKWWSYWLKQHVNSKFIKKHSEMWKESLYLMVNLINNVHRSGWSNISHIVHFHWWKSTIYTSFYHFCFVKILYFKGKIWKWKIGWGFFVGFYYVCPDGPLNTTCFT